MVPILMNVQNYSQIYLQQKYLHMYILVTDKISMWHSVRKYYPGYTNRYLWGVSVEEGVNRNALVSILSSEDLSRERYQINKKK